MNYKNTNAARTTITRDLKTIDGKKYVYMTKNLVNNIVMFDTYTHILSFCDTIVMLIYLSVIVFLVSL